MHTVCIYGFEPSRCELQYKLHLQNVYQPTNYAHTRYQETNLLPLQLQRYPLPPPFPPPFPPP